MESLMLQEQYKIVKLSTPSKFADCHIHSQIEPKTEQLTIKHDTAHLTQDIVSWTVQKR